MKLVINISFIFMILLIGCSKSNTVKPGVETTIRGIVMDSAKQRPVAGALLEIIETRHRGIFGGGGYFGVLDSVYSGPDGRYETTFKTSGRGNEYHISIIPPQKVAVHSGRVTFQPGGVKNIDFYVSELHTLKAMLQIINNPRPPLRVYSGFQSHEIYGTNKDTTVYLNVMPNNTNYIYFNITNPDSAQFFKLRIDTIFFAGFTDTFPRTFQLDPRTFPIRR